MSFSKIFKIHFIVDSTFIFFFIPECLNNSWWCLSSSFSDLKTEEEFSSISCPILGHHLIIVFDCENPFHLSGAFQEFFSLFIWRPSFRDYPFQLQLSFFKNLTGASFKFSLISSWSLCSLLSKYPSSIFICSLILPDASLFFFFVHF